VRRDLLRHEGGGQQHTVGAGDLDGGRHRPARNGCGVSRVTELGDERALHPGRAEREQVGLSQRLQRQHGRCAERARERHRLQHRPTDVAERDDQHLTSGHRAPPTRSLSRR
jgi:hypothetical protein